MTLTLDVLSTLSYRGSRTYLATPKTAGPR